MNTIDPVDLKRVTTFVTELQKLADKTGVTIFSGMGYAQLRIDDEFAGLKLDDDDTSIYRVLVVGDDVD